MKKVPSNLLFMSDEEYDFSQGYKKEKIYARIAEDWTDASIQEWLLFVEKYRVSPHTYKRWMDISNTFQKEQDTREAYVLVEESERISRNIDKFEALLADTKADENSIGSSRRFKHKAFLPNSVATELIRRFEVNPGVSVQHVLKVLATEIAERRIPPSITVDEIVDLVAETGGIDVWKAKSVHRLIE